MVILGSMSALGHVVFIWFHLQKQNEIKWKKMAKELSEKLEKKGAFRKTRK